MRTEQDNEGIYIQVEDWRERYGTNLFMVDEITGRIYAEKGDELQWISEICSHWKQEEVLSPAQSVTATPMMVMGTISTSTTVTPIPIAESTWGGVSHPEDRAGRTAAVQGRSRAPPITSYDLPEEDQWAGVISPMSSLQLEYWEEEGRHFSEIEFDWEDELLQDGQKLEEACWDMIFFSPLKQMLPSDGRIYVTQRKDRR